MKRAVVVAATALAVLASSQVSAREDTGGLRDVAVISNERGDSRILFRATGLALPERNVAIQRALIRFSIQGEPVARHSDIRIFPVLADWNPQTVEWDRGWQEPGGDFDRELYAREEIQFTGGRHEMAIDVTTLMKEIYEEGVEYHGFIVSVAPFEGEGIRAEDIARYQGIASASLDVRYRHTTGPPPRAGRERSQARRTEAQHVDDPR